MELHEGQRSASCRKDEDNWNVPQGFPHFSQEMSFQSTWSIGPADGFTNRSGISTISLLSHTKDITVETDLMEHIQV